MWRRKTAEAPYGWLSYRQNLIVLYEDLGRPDGKIDALIEKSAYEGGRARPAFPEQWADLNEMELRLFRLLDDARLGLRSGRVADAIVVDEFWRLHWQNWRRSDPETLRQIEARLSDYCRIFREGGSELYVLPALTAEGCANSGSR